MIREVKMELPLFDEITVGLKEHGVFEKKLSAQELAQIMSEIISLVAGQSSVSASVGNMNIQIENFQCKGSGTVHIQKPIEATIEIHCVLINDSESQKIELAGLTVKQNGNFIAKMALKAANIKEKIRTAFRDPNETLCLSLNSQIQSKGVKITETGIHFTENSLIISLKGQAD